MPGATALFFVVGFVGLFVSLALLFRFFDGNYSGQHPVWAMMIHPAFLHFIEFSIGMPIFNYGYHLLCPLRFRVAGWGDLSIPASLYGFESV